MYAIVEINGQQFKAEAGKKLIIRCCKYLSCKDSGIGCTVNCHSCYWNACWHLYDGVQRIYTT